MHGIGLEQLSISLIMCFTEYHVQFEGFLKRG